MKTTHFRKRWKHQTFITMAMTAVLTIHASANHISDSQLGQGVKQLLQDASSFMIVLCPIAGGSAAIYFAMRRSAADEQDGKMWSHRIKTAILCGVGGGLVGGVITLLSSYF